VGIRAISRSSGLWFTRFWSRWIHGDESYESAVSVMWVLGVCWIDKTKMWVKTVS